MTENHETTPSQERRAILKKLGRFALVSAPAVTLLLAAGTKPAKAIPCSNCGSSRAFKTPEGRIDGAAMLMAVTALPVGTGADAEGFQAAFRVGDGARIHPIDGVGVCLAAIQGLAQRLERLEGQLKGPFLDRAA